MLYNNGMIKEIKIYNRFNMETFARHEGLNFPYKYWYLISIHSGDALITPDTRKVFKDLGCQGLISLDFWDITPEDKRTVLKSHPDVTMFDKKHARKIVDFLDKIQKDKNDSVLVAHCHAGISRSGAVGTFVCDYCQLDYDTFMKLNPYIQSNSHVLRTLRREAKMTPSFGTHDGIDPQENDGFIIF